MHSYRPRRFRNHEVRHRHLLHILLILPRIISGVILHYFSLLTKWPRYWRFIPIISLVGLIILFTNFESKYLYVLDLFTSSKCCQGSQRKVKRAWRHQLANWVIWEELVRHRLFARKKNTAVTIIIPYLWRYAGEVVSTSSLGIHYIIYNIYIPYIYIHAAIHTVYHGPH